MLHTARRSGKLYTLTQPHTLRGSLPGVMLKDLKTEIREAFRSIARYYGLVKAA